MSELIEVAVGAIGKPHGIRGALMVDLRTDEPERRFSPGAVLRVEGTPRTLTVGHSSWHGGRLRVEFQEINDRTGAEAARGWVLVCDVPADELPEDEDEFYDRQLVGLTAVLSDGSVVGTVTEVVHLPAQDLLAIDVEGTERLVPFVNELVPRVDLGAGQVELVALPGLLEDEGAEVVDPQAGEAGR